MICFFYFMENIKVIHKDQGVAYEHSFEQVLDQNRKNIPLDKIYFSTPSDYHNQMENLNKQFGEKAKELVHLVNPEKIVALEGFPKHIGFGNLEENIAHLKGKPEVKIAILNAMSNAIGDHLIGMQAFDHWYERVCQILEGSKVSVSFFQLNPYRVGAITEQWQHKIDSVYMLPHRITKLAEHDAFIDLGTLLLREGFDTEHMIDFFFKALSIDPASVPAERKRMKYVVPPEPAAHIGKMFQTIRSKGRPILLFHRSSTTPIRELPVARARQIVAEIIKKSDYFVVSADGLDYQNKRFMDISGHSRSLDNFAAIISQSDAIVTVDTSTFHLADAFSIPTIVLFTSIDPKLRTKYYPHVGNIMLEEKTGFLYGKHKAAKDPEELKKELAYLDALWDKLKVDDILQKLKEITN